MKAMSLEDNFEAVIFLRFVNLFSISALWKEENVSENVSISSREMH